MSGISTSSVSRSGSCGGNLLQRVQAIARQTDHLNVLDFAQDIVDRLSVKGGVVHDQDLRLCELTSVGPSGRGNVRYLSKSRPRSVGGEWLHQ